MAPDGGYKHKCELENVKPAEGTDLTHKNFFVETPTLRRKRTVQNKLVEYAILKMFSKQTIFSLVDVLFKDMKQDYKIYEEAADMAGEQPGQGAGKRDQGGNEGEEDEPGEGEENGGDGPDMDDQLIDYTDGGDIDRYMEVKGVLYIEKIKDIVGEIMGSCQKQLKYEILEYIMKGVIFEKKMLRESFMQEVLKASDNAAFRQSLQYYLNQNGKTVRAYFQRISEMQGGGGPAQILEGAGSSFSTPGAANETAALLKSGALNRAEHTKNDRIIVISWVDLCCTDITPPEAGPDKQINSSSKSKNAGYSVRLLVVTNQGVQILRKGPAPDCTRCPPQNFCPRGPSQERCIQYQDIKTIISHPQIPQKITILFHERAAIYDARNMFSDGKDRLYQLTVNIPTYTKSSRIYSNLVDIMRGIESEQLKQPQPLQLPKGAKAAGGPSTTPGAPGHAAMGKGATTKQGAQSQAPAAGPYNEKDYQQAARVSCQDTFLLFQLRMLLNQPIFNEKKLKTRKVKTLEMTFATLRGSSLFKKGGLADLFAADSVGGGGAGTSGGAPMGGTPGEGTGGSFFSGFMSKNKGGSAAGGGRQMENCVLLFIAKGKLYIAKENWSAWSSDFSTDRAAKDQLKKALTERQSRMEAEQAKELDGAPGKAKAASKEADESGRSQEILNQAKLRKQNAVELFDVLICLEISQITRLYVHKGHAPSVQIKCFP